jgi:hypothetical protein
MTAWPWNPQPCRLVTVRNRRPNSCLSLPCDTTVVPRFNGSIAKIGPAQPLETNFFTQNPQIVDKFLIA